MKQVIEAQRAKREKFSWLDAKLYILRMELLDRASSDMYAFEQNKKYKYLIEPKHKFLKFGLCTNKIEAKGHKVTTLGNR